MCDFILYFNDYVLHLCVINDDDKLIAPYKHKISSYCHLEHTQGTCQNFSYCPWHTLTRIFLGVPSL